MDNKIVDKNTNDKNESLSLNSQNDDLKESLHAEVLYKSGLEELEVGKEVHIYEEGVSFTTPTMPEYISEEVLFTNVESDNIDKNLENYEMATVSFDEQVVADFDDDENKNSTEYSYLDKNFKSKRFSQKILESEEVVVNNYCHIKNYIMRYKKMKSRYSFSCETYNIGRDKFFKIAISGKSIKLYLSLNFSEVDVKYNCKDLSDKPKFQEVPVLLKVRSPRSLKYAEQLIDAVANKYGFELDAKNEELDVLSALQEDAKC